MTAELGLDVEMRQTDDEVQLIGWIHAATDERTPVVRTPVVLNPGAFTHYSFGKSARCAIALK